MQKPVRSRPSIAAAFSALAILALAGCGGDPSRVLARVGSRTITIDDFLEAARDDRAQYPASPDSARALLLDDLLRRTLVLCDAERLGMYRDTAVAIVRRQVEDEILQQAMYRQLVPADIPVSDGEIERLYAWRDSAAHVLAIFSLTRGAADAAMAELRRGTPFSAVADRLGASGALPPGGDLGLLPPGSLVPALDRYLRAGPLRTPIGPVESPGEGWFILQVLERSKRAQAPLDAQRAILRDILRQRKQSVLRQRALAALRESYDVRPESGGAQAMFAFFHRAEAESAGLDLAAASPPERSTVLLRYEAGGVSGVYTLGDALLDLGVYGREKPTLSMIPSIERWIDIQAIRRVAAIEARRRHLHEEPETLRKIQQRVDNQVLDAYYATEVAHGDEPGPEDVREAYERAKDSYQRLDEVELLEVTLADSAAAAGLVAHAGHAPSLREAVEMASPGARVRAERVRYPNAPERWKEYQSTFMEMTPHECLGPVAVPGGWLVAQMVSKRQEAQPFDRLPPQVVELLRRQAVEIRNDHTFRQITDRLRRELKPEVHPERLRDVRWPIVAAAGPG